MKFEVMVNKAKMKSKDQCLKWTGAIKKNRAKGFKSHIRTVDEHELADIIRAGHTIVPAILSEEQPLHRRYFQYQQVFGLDFDNKNPAKDAEKAGDAYYMTIDKIMDVCRQYEICPVVIYETFSSRPEWKKYRVMFVTEKPIDDKEYRKMFLMSLMKLFAVNGILTTDSKCIDEGRIFYAGHTIVAVCQNVPVNPDEVIEVAKDIEIYEVDKKRHSKEQSGEKGTVANEMIEAIMKRDISSYIELLSKAVSEDANIDADWTKGQSGKTQTIIFKNILKDYCLGITQQALEPTESITCDDVFELTSYLPLHLMLGLPYGKEFSCILPQHADETPSATINLLGDGRYVYNCWGCINENHYYDVVDVFSLLMDTDIGEAVKFILTAIGLEVETEWQKKQREMIDGNIKYINSEYFKKRHSILYKEMIRAKVFGQLNFFLSYAKEHIPPESLMRDGRPTFFLSIRKAAELMKAADHMGTSTETISRKLILLNMFGFFDKVAERDIPSEILQRAVAVAQKNAADNNRKFDYRQDFLFIPSYTAKMFMDAEEFIITNRQNAVRRSSLAREQILRTYGKDAADSLYTQDTYREHSAVSVKFYNRFQEVARMMMTTRGFVSEAEILKKIKGYSSEEKKRLSGQCLPQLMMENGYERIRVNKESRATYGITDKYKSGCYVLVRAFKRDLSQTVV
jgi:hypothetical protein